MKKEVEVIEGNNRYKLIFTQGWFNRRLERVRVFVDIYETIQIDGFEPRDDNTWFVEYLDTKTGEIYNEEDSMKYLYNMIRKEWLKIKGNFRNHRKVAQ
jgi:hypothetical protein